MTIRQSRRARNDRSVSRDANTTAKGAPMIGSILNQIRQARALELRALTADALAEAQLQSYAIQAIEEEHRRSLKSA
jgi:hypothetical protein